MTNQKKIVCCHCLEPKLSSEGEWLKDVFPPAKLLKIENNEKTSEYKADWQLVGDVKKFFGCENCRLKNRKRHEREKKRKQKKKKDKEGSLWVSRKYLEEFTEPLTKKLEKVENLVSLSQEPTLNIYNFDTIYHWVGWLVFLVSAIISGRWVYKEKTRKKIIDNYWLDIQEKFKEWRLNMYFFTVVYVALFFLIEQAISKWVKPNIDQWVLTKTFLTVALISLFIGFAAVLDGHITSSLKTPLQRLSIKIEGADIDEKEKNELLAKTQNANELFKETLKRFGLLTVTGILIKLIESLWNKHPASYLCYFVPLVYAAWTIWEVDRMIKKIGGITHTPSSDTP